MRILVEECLIEKGFFFAVIVVVSIFDREIAFTINIIISVTDTTSFSRKIYFAKQRHSTLRS